MAERMTRGDDQVEQRTSVPCWACGEEMEPGLSWHRDHDARSPLERALDAELGIDCAERDRHILARRVQGREG